MKQVFTTILFLTVTIIFVIVIIKADEEQLGAEPVIQETVVEKLVGKTANEKATIKGQEIAKLNKITKTTRAKYDIEITRINTIDAGVEVFARAWNANGQIGFGKDGTVDIERFRITNPPVLVPDVNGTITIGYYNAVTGETTYQNFREDTEEAVLQVLEQTISVKKEVFDDSKIIVGEIGNTTTIVYPDADPESTTVDGRISNSALEGEGWTDNHDASIGDDVSESATTFYANTNESGGLTLGYSISRCAILFDTSTISGETVSSWTLSLYSTGKKNTDNDGLDYINVYTSTPATDTALIGDDFDQFGSTGKATAIDFGDITTSAYNVWTGTDNTVISTTGITKLGIREGHDAENTPIALNMQNYAPFSAAEDSGAGTTQDPKLTVESAVATASVPSQSSDWMDFD